MSLTTTSNPKIVRPSLLFSHIAALETNSTSSIGLLDSELELMSALRFSSVGRDFKLFIEGNIFKSTERTPCKRNSNRHAYV